MEEVVELERRAFFRETEKREVLRKKLRDCHCIYLYSPKLSACRCIVSFGNEVGSTCRLLVDQLISTLHVVEFPSKGGCQVEGIYM